MTDATLSRGFMTDRANRAAARYRSLFGVVRLLEAAMAVAMIVSPRGVARLLGASDSFGAAGESVWVRIAGVILLIMLALFSTGRTFPSSAKLTNLLGIVGQIVLGGALMAGGGRLLWVGAGFAIAGILLGLRYVGLFKAEVMSRP